jgi:hypothetical protein
MSKKGLVTILCFFTLYIIVWGYSTYFHNVNWTENHSGIGGVLVAVLFWIYYCREKEVELKKSYRIDAIIFSLVAAFNVFVFLSTL